MGARMEALRKKMKKRNILRDAAFALVFVIFVAYALTIFYAMFWLLTNSFKTVAEWDESKFSLPKAFLKQGVFANFASAWRELNFDNVRIPGMLFNSVWYSVGGAFVGVWFCGMTAYVIAKYRFIGRNVVYSVAIIQMLLPIVGNLPAAYKMYNDLHITNSPLLLVTSASGLGGNFLILYASYQGVSDSYMEAARIDGAGHLSIFFRVMLPQVVPSMFAIFLLGFIGAWNDYQGPLLYLPDFPTLATGLMAFEKQMVYDINMPVYFAGTILLIIPTITLFAIFSDKMMTSVSVGGLKG